MRVRIAALPARQGVDRAFGAARRGFEADASLLFSPPASRRGRRRFARRVRAGMPLLCGGCGCGLLRRPAAQGAVPKGRQGRILNRAFPCGFYRLLRGGGRPLGTREDFFGEKDHADPAPAFAQPYSRSTESKEKAVCAPWRGEHTAFSCWGFQRGQRPPFWHAALQRAVQDARRRGRRGAALFAPRLLRPENRPPLCERE